MTEQRKYPEAIDEHLPRQVANAEIEQVRGVVRAAYTIGRELQYQDDLIALTSERAKNNKLEEENDRLRKAVVRNDKLRVMVREMIEELGGPITPHEKTMYELAKS